mmetsp:Transcript_17443/g.54451  ORF Transcript_17443/g.54451 Transcript_17443/m.54451 type:complete len:163 (+) Transcript_17443:46-534(+)
MRGLLNRRVPSELEGWDAHKLACTCTTLQAGQAKLLHKLAMYETHGRIRRAAMALRSRSSTPTATATKVRRDGNATFAKRRAEKIKRKALVHMDVTFLEGGERQVLTLQCLIINNWRVFHKLVVCATNSRLRLPTIYSIFASRQTRPKRAASRIGSSFYQQR